MRSSAGALIIAKVVKDNRRWGSGPRLRAGRAHGPAVATAGRPGFYTCATSIPAKHSVSTIVSSSCANVREAATGEHSHLIRNGRGKGKPT
jgi:hypothetical protein